MEALEKIAGYVRDPNVTIDTTAFFFALLLSLVVSLALSFLYRYFYEDRATGSQSHRAFVLLGPSITALFIAIQYSLPLSLGLMGALSIVRFRTPIKEPEEIGFIMLLCACSVVIATFKLLLLLALLCTVILGLFIKNSFPVIGNSSRKDGLILVNFSNEDLEKKMEGIRRILEDHVKKGKLESVSEMDGSTTIQYSFCDLNSNMLSSLSEKLSGSNEINSFNLYFNRSGSLI